MILPHPTLFCKITFSGEFQRCNQEINLIETDMLSQLSSARPDALPVGRFGTVEEVGQVAVMLARNGYITGQTINVDGGRYPT